MERIFPKFKNNDKIFYSIQKFYVTFFLIGNRLFLVQKPLLCHFSITYSRSKWKQENGRYEATHWTTFSTRIFFSYESQRFQSEFRSIFAINQTEMIGTIN